MWARQASAREVTTMFETKEGDPHRVADWKGQPVLVVNTGSQCGFTGKYGDLQRLQDTYGPKGLVVLAVPSDDFNQELGSEAEVKEFCELNYDLTLPMTGITPVKGSGAHPFFRSVAQETGFQPRWNFNKILIAPDGTVAGTYGSRTKPMSRTITGKVEELLKGGKG